MGSVLEVDRTRVMAYRVAAQQLDRRAGKAGELAVLALGVQDTPVGVARQAIAARSSELPGERDLVMLWATRGAPHLHRWAEVGTIAAALWPVSDADASARIANARMKEGAALGLKAFTAAAEAMREVVTEPMPKGEVSTAVSARIPKSLTYWCPACQAQHISGALFQQVGAAAGVRLVPGKATTLAPIEGAAEVPVAAVGADALVGDYLRLLGPATPAEAAKYLGTTSTAVRPAWPEGLTEVRVDGRRTWIPEDRVEALRAAAVAESVRLIPPSDPFLQARDRNLIVPGKAHQKDLWRPLGNPGALLVDGEIAGTWRARMAGKKVLEITVTPFGALPDRRRAAVEDEAGHTAAARGVKDLRVVWPDQAGQAE